MSCSSFELQSESAADEGQFVSSVQDNFGAGLLDSSSWRSPF